MTNLMKTTALSLTVIASATSAFAASHAATDATEISCSMFTGMEILDQDKALQVLINDVDGAMNDDINIAEVAVLCIGNDDEMVATLPDGDADS